MPYTDSDVNDLKERLYYQQHGLCAVCGKPLDFTNFHAAHIVPQRKHWLKLYGKRLIMHEVNMKATCPTDACNGAVSLGNNAHRVEKHMQYIKEQFG
jgi:Fe2+ or Zn2+ uptake regulation protein